MEQSCAEAVVIRIFGNFGHVFTVMYYNQDWVIIELFVDVTGTCFYVEGDSGLYQLIGFGVVSSKR